jgi:hypothetical protein
MEILNIACSLYATDKSKMFAKRECASAVLQVAEFEGEEKIAAE